MDEFELMAKNKELMIMNVEYNLAKMGLYSEEGTYDYKNVPKLMNKFYHINKLSYGELSDFVNHISNCRKYYKCEACRNFANEIIKTIKRFVNSFDVFLI